MKRIVLASLVTLAMSLPASAEPWWAQISLATTASNAPKVLAAADAFMASELGKSFPGRLLLQANLATGANPNTHSFVPIYKSAADREAFVSKLQGNADWVEFQVKLEGLSQQGGTVQYRNVKNWGDINDTDDTWMAHAIAVSDPAAYLAAFDALMASPTGKKFPGQVYLSAVVAGGLSPVTHLVSVGYDSVQEMADWMTVRDASSDWATFQTATQAVSEYQGGSLAGTVKTWGSPLQQVVRP
jgi:hypothetical protein